MEWSDAFLLGFAPLDAVHQEFVTLVAALQAAGDEELPGRLEDVLNHAVAHFDQEALWMRQTSFPATQCHIDEHEAVLASLRDVRELVRSGGDVAEVRRLGAALADWFPGHADYMDAALSHWMCKRTYGGAPVVVRRPAMPAAKS
jgi:hemerythrin